MPADTRSAVSLLKLAESDLVVKNIAKHRSKHWSYYRKVNSSMHNLSKQYLHNQSSFQSPKTADKDSLITDDGLAQERSTLLPDIKVRDSSRDLRRS